MAYGICTYTIGRCCRRTHFDWQDSLPSAAYQLILPRGGSFMHIEPVNVEEATHDYTLELQCHSNCDVEYTKISHRISFMDWLVLIHCSM